MTIRTNFIEKWNYTGRKRIKQKTEFFQLKAGKRTANEALFSITWDLNKICSSLGIPKDGEHLFVLDAMFQGNTQRFELQACDSEKTVTVTECPDLAQIDFRLKLVSAEERTRGRLLAATAWFNLDSGAGEDPGQAVSNGFFRLILSDSLGEQIWKITWPTPDNPQISLNRRYHNKFKDTAILRAHLFPEIVRGVLLGIIIRNVRLDEIDKGSIADDWLTFAEQRLGYPLRGEQAEVPEDHGRLLDLVDNIVQYFSERKWRGGKSLLEEALK